MRRRITRHNPIIGVPTTSNVDASPEEDTVRRRLRREAPRSDDGERRALQTLLARLFGDGAEDAAEEPT